MNDPRSIFRRVIIGLGLLGTFVLTASVFAPDQSQAREFGLIRDPIDGVEETDVAVSTDAHEGLRSLGSFETTQHIIKAFCTDAGPRYSIYDARTRREIAVLMSVDDIARYHPEIPLRGVKFEVPADGDGAVGSPLMMADPIDRSEPR